MDHIVAFFQDGGPFMLINISFLVLGMGVVLERIIVVFFVLPINEKIFTASVEKYLKAGNIDAAAKVCQAAPRPALSRATRTLLSLLRNGYESPMMAVEEAMMDVRALVMTRVSWLWAIANIATLVGLIGTVAGLINAFQAISAVAADQRAAALSKGISEAMNNTAFGLSIAVLCILGHLVVSSKAASVTEKAEHALFHFMNVHAQWRKGPRAADAAAPKA